MTRCTSARLRRSTCSSISVATRNAAPRIPSAPVGSRHSTRVPRDTGATSRLVTDQAPPSTYSRPPIRTGSNTAGIAHDACTASATLAFGAPGAPNTTRRPFDLSTVHTRRRPSKRARQSPTRLCRSVSG